MADDSRATASSQTDASNSTVQLQQAGTGNPVRSELDSVYRSDPRVAALLTECSQMHYYNRDTSYMIPVLIEKLQKGYTEPLQRAKNELAELGEEAMIEVQRLAETWYTDQTHAAYAQNALDVAVISDEPLARKIVLRFLMHPRDSFRRIALRGMTMRHARPEDFDPLWFQLEGESVGVQEQFIPALHKADPARAEELFLDWFDQETHVHLWPSLGPFLASSTIPETLERCSFLQVHVAATVRPFIAAAAARGGDQEALDAVMEALADEVPARRAFTAVAAASAQLVEPLLSALKNDSAAAVRLTAIGALAKLEPDERLNTALAEAMGDPDRQVRVTALTALVNRGDTAATNRALALLDGDSDQTHDATVAIRERMKTDRGLAGRARERMLAKYETIVHLPLDKRFVVLKPLGLIPGKETARALKAIAEANPEPINDRRSHLMIMVHASNSGVEGRGWLFDQLEHETDPLKRIDLLWASTCYRTDEARQRLHSFLSDEERSPYELLVAADALARLGPAEEVASLLKRICYRILQDDVRNGMRCLLWKWY